MRSSLTRYALLAGVLAAVSAFTLHCGGDDDSTTPAGATTSAEGSFAGAMIGVDFAASVKLTIPSGTTRPAALRPQAVGPITVTGTIDSAQLGVPVTITGTYDPATQIVTFSGSSPRGEIKFRGTYENGVISGDPAETPGGLVPLVLVAERLGVHVYCGEVRGATRGLLGVFTAGDRAGAAYAVDGTRGALLGVTRGTSIDVQGGGAKIAGDVNGATLSGTFTGASGASGTYVATEGGCASLLGGVLDGGTDGGTDAGTDAGPPKTPTTLYTAGMGIGHMTLSAGTLYFTLAHPYYSQKMEVWKVGVDGKNDTAILPVNDPAVETRQNPSGLAVVGSTVYISGGTSPPGGGAALYTLPTSGGVLSLPADMGTAALMENFDNFVGDAAGLYRADCAGFSSARGFSLGGAPGGVLSNLVGACAVATDGTNVFIGGGQLTGILRVPNAFATSNQTAATVANADDYKIGAYYPSMQSMTVDATHVYWAGADNAGKKGGVWRRPKDGSGTTQTLTITDKLHRGAIAVDDTFVYFFNVDSGGGQGGAPSRLYRVAKTATNGTPEPIGPGNPGPLLTDGTYVYWASGATIQRLAR